MSIRNLQSLNFSSCVNYGFQRDNNNTRKKKQSEHEKKKDKRKRANQSMYFEHLMTPRFSSILLLPLSEKQVSKCLDAKKKKKWADQSN